ncbi:hypothetical protein [Vibrio sp. HN007]|uniref:hypothetical protein n=1 Tax=Vibrio iocasae TaxID=3098914 RepID=UPI0035D42919
MNPINVNNIVERTLQLASDIESDLYQYARHSSKLKLIEEVRLWLKFGQKKGSLTYACTYDGGKNLRELCYEVFSNVGFSFESLTTYSLSMCTLIGNEGYYAIRFNTDDDKEYAMDDYYVDEDGYIDQHFNKNGDMVVPYRQVLLTVWREKESHLSIHYHTFYHALWRYLLDKEEHTFAQQVAEQFGLNEESEYYCDRLAIIPSLLDELTSEIILANRSKWREYSFRSREIKELINGQFYNASSSLPS